MTPQERDQVIVGSDAEDFVDSEIGQNVLKVAKADAEEAVARFLEADVTDHKALTKIQIELKVAVRFEQYLYELIQRGREVMDSQKQED